MADEAQDPWTGQTLAARYRIDAKLDLGGRASVFAATDLASGARVAIERLPPERAGAPPFLERFRRDGLAPSALADPGALPPLEVGELPDGARFLAVQPFEGSELDALLRAEGPPPAGRALRPALAFEPTVRADPPEARERRDASEAAPGMRPVRPWAWLGALVVAAGLAALAVLVGMEREPSAEGEPPMAALPTPRAPRAQPMVAMGESGIGWSWVNPIPRAMPTWYALDVAGGGDPVVIVGRGGAAVRYEQGELFAWSTGTERDLRGVTWTGAREAIAVGEGGVIVRLTATGPRSLEAGTTATLRDAVALSATDVLVVGDAGTVLRLRGERVSAVDVGEGADLLAAFVHGERTFVVGARGTVLRLEGSSVARERSGVSSSLRAVGGCPGGTVYAAGDEGTLLRRLRGGSWQRLRVFGREAFTAVSCDHGRVAATRRDGGVLLVHGERSEELPSGFESPWYALGGGLRGSTWMAGAGGRLATIEADHVRTRTAGPTVPIRALGSMGGALVAAGEWGRILRERERGLEQVDSPTDAGLAGLVQLGEGHLLAVGDFGAMVDVQHDRAVLVESPTQVSLRAGVAQGDELLVVGAQGHVLRGALGVLRVSVVAGAGDLWAVGGSPRDAVVVGEGGLVLRVRDGASTRVPCAGEGTLRAVARTPEGTWAAGDRGRVVRIEAGGCVEEHGEGPTLHALGVGPHGRLLSAGDDGTVLARGPGGRWTPEAVDVGGASIRVIWRSDRHVYLGGSEGVLVRHPRMD